MTLSITQTTQCWISEV